MLALIAVLLVGWTVAGLWVLRWRYQPVAAVTPRYPAVGIVIPDHLGPFPLTDREIVDLFLKADWQIRLDQPVAAGREW